MEEIRYIKHSLSENNKELEFSFTVIEVCYVHRGFGDIHKPSSTRSSKSLGVISIVWDAPSQRTP